MRTILLSFAAVCGLVLLSFSPEKVQGRLPKEIRKEYAFIKEGILSIDNGCTPVSAFFMKSGEVTNGEYLEFIQDLEKSGNQELLHIAMPDTTAWRMNSAYNEPFVTHYFRHPAYSNYPVVCVSYEGAKAYCDWKTQKSLANKTKDGFTAYYRLPTKNEWIYAANNGHPASDFSWGGGEINNLKGCPLCNYKQLPSDLGADPTWPTALDDNAMYTAPTKSYSPSEWGIYNQNGNVAEIVNEKGIAMGGSWNSIKSEVTNTSEMAFNGPSPMVGFRPVMSFMMSK
jgi:formylglycine-generating enzyme required for sulfatase activity